MTTAAQPNSGGLAPADRQCHYTLSNGLQCRNWALRGHDHCHPHHRYLAARPERPIDVPLLEDPGSILYVLSQTAQALAWGTLPTANGHAILALCRQAQSVLSISLETAKLRLRARRHGIPEHELFADPPSTLSPDSSTLNPAPSTLAPAPCTLTPAPTPNPVKVPPKNVRFRDLKKDWDKALIRAENAAGAVCARRPGETREEFEAARATPFDHLAAIDREVEQARTQPQPES